MAVFSKFAVSVAVVAVGYEEERCETVSALRMEGLAAVEQGLKINDFMFPKTGESTFLGPGPSEVVPGALERHLNSQNKKKKEVVKHANAVELTTLPDILEAKSGQGFAKTQKGPITTQQITEIVESFQNKEVLNKALDRIKCQDFADKNAMWKLFELLRNASDAQKKKFSQKVAQLDEAIRSTQGFKTLFDKVINGTESKGTGSKCDLKVVLEQLAEGVLEQLAEGQRTAVVQQAAQQAAEELKTMVSCVEPENSVYQNPEWWGGIGVLLIFMCCIVCCIAVCCAKPGTKCCCFVIRP